MMFKRITVIFLVFCSFLYASANLKSQADLNILFIVDGLRPDQINSEDTPTIYKLVKEGVFFENSHAVFPTVTRVNSAAIASGAYPEKSGIVSNSMYVPAIHPNQAFSTGEYENLLKLEKLSYGNLITMKTAAQRLAEKGQKMVAISSGSTGSGFLLNHKAIDNVGAVINGYFEGGQRVAYPDAVNDAILQEFGAAPDLSAEPNFNTKVNWTTKVLTDYVLPVLKPDVLFCWITEPDHTQHGAGIGSPETIKTIVNSDKNIETVLQKLKDMDIYNRTNIFIVSDHGFSTYKHSINVAQELIKAGLKESKDSDDIVLASSGQSVLIHVKDRNMEKIKSTINFLQKQDWTGVLFTAASFQSLDKTLGWVDGTFSLELIHQPSNGRGADILLTFPWTSEKNKFGFAGMDMSATNGQSGPRNGTSAGHGSMSPWTIRNTMIAWGVDVKSGVRNKVPGCSIDFTATILALKGVKLDDNVQGRIITEALKQGPDAEKVPFETKTFTRETANSTVHIQISQMGDYWYVDKSWRTIN
jgi:arylsulfatase A-like enzyme